jgi:hypothetical protein
MSEKIVDGIAWTPELRARVYPARTIANPTYRDDFLRTVDLTYPIDADAAREGAARYWKSEKTDIARAKEGLKKNPAHWRSAVEAVLARCKKPQVDQPLDVDVEAATVALEICPLFMALPYWIAAGGIPFAMRALIRCHEVVSYAWVYGYSNTRTWISSRAITATTAPRTTPRRGAVRTMSRMRSSRSTTRHGIADERACAPPGYTEPVRAPADAVRISRRERGRQAEVGARPRDAAQARLDPGLARYVRSRPWRRSSF